VPAPLVSIVTPSFNHARFIRATIESVLSQDYPRIEYIVMDGGSGDETASIVRDYSSRLTWVSEPDRGQSHAINKGFSRSRGSILFWLNSDDLILPGAVRRAVGAFEENRHAGAVYGEGFLIDEQGNTTRRFPCTEPFNLWRLLYVSDYILQQTAYFRRSAIEKAGYLREDLHFAMDWDLLIRLAKLYPLQYIPEYMGCLREYASAKSFSGGARRASEIARLLREHTGQRMAPGAIVYGLETYSKIWCDAIEARLPGLLAKPVQSLIAIACAELIGRSAQRSQGWFGDGWAAPRLKYMLPPGSRRVFVLSGWSPQLSWRQRLSIIAGGECLARREFHGGDFQWRVPMPDSAGPLRLEIRASRSFVPALRGEGSDTRRLAYLLRSILVDQRSHISSGIEDGSELVSSNAEAGKRQ